MQVLAYKQLALQVLKCVKGVGRPGRNCFLQTSSKLCQLDLPVYNLQLCLFILTAINTVVNCLLRNIHLNAELVFNSFNDYETGNCMPSKYFEIHY